MILSFKNQATADIFDGKSSKVARKVCPQNLWRVAIRKLDQLDSVVSIDELKIPPGNRLEPLLGDLKGLYILKPLENASFRMTEQFIIKALVCINGCSLKKTSNAEYDLLRHPRRAGL